MAGTIGVASWVLMLALLLGLALLPVLLALPPVDVSSACEGLREGLTLLRARDPCGENVRIGSLYEVLRLLNKENGLGFKVCGTVFNRRRLLEGLLFLYTVLGTVTPLLLQKRGS
jgi:hypothetical protein